MIQLHGKEERLKDDHSEVVLSEKSTKDGDAPRRFKAKAYSGVDVGRLWGRMVINSAGIRREKNTGMLMEHDDSRPVAVCESMEVDEKTGRVDLEGYFLSDKASGGESTRLLAMADEGFPLKMSVGIRLLKYHDLEEGATEEVNGRTFSGPITIVDEAHLFETSFIAVSPADLDTSAAVMRARAQESQMADKTETREALAANLPPATTQTLDREAILKEGRELAVKERAQLLKDAKKALPLKADKKLRLQVISKKITLERAKELAAERLKNKVIKLEARGREREASIAELKARGFNVGSGVNGSDLPSLDAVTVSTLALDERVAAELRSNPRISLWGEESFRAYRAYLKSKDKVSTNPLNPVKFFDHPTTRMAIEKMANDLRFLTQGGAERLDVGKSGPDYSRMTVNGFVGSFYASYEEALSANWSQEASYQIASDQQAEVVRWLGPPPQMQEWTGPRIAKELPIYQQLLQAKLFESTVGVDKFDWDHQKFDAISRSFGLLGPVAGQHWDIRFSKLLEDNPTAYDGFSLWSHTHTLGGDSGTIDNDLISSNGYPVLAVGDPDNLTQIEAARILMALPPHMKTYAWANGIKMNATMQKLGVMVHPNYEGIFDAVINSDRLDTGQSNPLAGQRHRYKILPNPYLTKPQYGYFMRLDTPNKLLLKAEPDPITMTWLGPGSDTAFKEHKYLMGLESVRSIGPGAFESGMRFTIGAA